MDGPPGRPALKDEWDKQWPADGDPAVDVARALENFYNLFALDFGAANLWIKDGRVEIVIFVEDMRTAATAAPDY